MASIGALLIALFVIYTEEFAEAEDSLLVNIKQGPVRGYKAAGENIFIFYGIPYATAPTGTDRFKPSLPPPEWTDTFEAVNKDIVCPQASYYLMGPKKIQEDCLVANIYVPDTAEKNLPVAVYVHGGGFQMLYGEFTHHTQFLKEHNLIVVNFNYRLGPHGFLCLGTQDVPGNAAMKDVIAMLRWVKANIAYFKGNPNDVSAIGYSAGSTIVELLLMSPLSQGLFNKVILEGGSALGPFSIQMDPIENAWLYANMLNLTSPSNKNDIYALEEFYKSIPYDILHSINLMDGRDSAFIFSPCIERDVGEEMFLDDAPINILKQGKQQKLPILSGYTEMEGLLRIRHFEVWKSEMNDNFSNFLPYDLTFPDENERDRVALEIKKYYFGNRDVDETTVFRFIDYFTDVMFSYSTIRATKLHVISGNSKIYLYEYDFVQRNSLFVPHSQVRGASHCMQTYGVVDGNYSSIEEETLPIEFIEMKKVMRQLWANFVITGEPVPDGSDLHTWPPVDADCGPHMLLDTTMKLRGPLLQQRSFFWDGIYEKYYRMPKPPLTPPPKI